MRRTIWLLAGVLLCVAALGSDSPKEYDDKTEVRDELEGTWERTDFTYFGRKLELPYQEVATFRHGILTRKFSPGETVPGSYRINPTRSPAHLDWTPSTVECKGQTLKWIYKVKADTLKIANVATPNDEQRPKGFGDDNLSVSTYKRLK
jgi:uncharacterized protein (TIGR03067 family)